MIPNWFTLNNDTEIQDGISVSSDVAILSKAEKLFIKNENIHFVKAKALKDLCIKPNKNEQYRIITEKQFNAYALILYILEQEEIEELYLAIYRINEPTVEALIKLINCGKIKKATFVISNYFNQTKKPEKWALKLREYCKGNKNTKHIYIHNHSKIVALKTKENYYIMEGSGNMSDNARIEQYVFDNNKTIFDFHKEWISKLVEK